MQRSPSTPVTGDVVTVRRQRWRVLQAHSEADCTVLSLAGAGAFNAGVVQPFIAPFDIVEPAVSAPRVVRVSLRRWRRSARALVASTAPAGSLRVLAGSQMDLLPHQLEPALAIVRGTCVRALLADDVGLGKTIEAGLVLAELRARAAVERALILTPAGLRDQWRAELNERFGIDAVIGDLAALAAASAAYVGQPNPWRTFTVAIASFDLAKRPEHLAAILQCRWDLLVVDEAHNVASDSDRHAAVEAIARRTPYVVLVTATPHNGDPAAFASLCGIGAHGDRCAVFRRTRADAGLAGRRRSHLLRVRPAVAERQMHAALASLTRAVRREHGESAIGTWLAIAVLNKRALSSAHALWRSVTRRLETLAGAADDSFEPSLPFDDPDGELDPSDEPPAWRGGPVLADGRREERLLSALARAAASAAAEGESKLRAMRRWLRRVEEPVIIFSEYRDTLQHVADSIGRPSLLLHGGLAAAERRRVLDAFPARVPILLATDTAGEGLNLHDRCRCVINLELPWSPVRLEQRIGRVDRIGQARTVHAVVMVAGGTPEERVLDRLRDRIARARRDVVAPDSIVTEREVERFVLGGSRPDAPRPADPRENLFWPGFAPEAVAEAARVRLARQITGPGAREEPAAVCHVARTRNGATRTQLGSRALVLAELIVEDGRGALVERILLPLLTDAESADMLARAQDLQPLMDAIGSRCDEVRAIVAHFSTARMRRERAIAAASQIGHVTIQPGLFDRRAERTALAIRAAAEAAYESIARRAALAASAAAGSTFRLSIRSILRTRR